MNHHVKPTLRENKDHFIIHIWTNDVTNNSKSHKVIDDSITKLAIQLKNKSHDVTICNITTRRDKWSVTVDEVNRHFEELFEKKNIYLLENSMPLKALDLSRSRLCFNKK